MSIRKWFALSLVWAVGIATIIGSSVKEDGPPPAPPVPVTVTYTLISQATPLSRQLETRTAELSALRLTGSYAANQGEKLTLDRNSISLDIASGFDVSITAINTDELLEGTTEFDITATLDVGLEQNPVAGQFRSDFNGTTTIVTVSGNNVDVLIGDSMTTDTYSWTNFIAWEDDTNATLDLRMASAAYNMVDVVLRVVRLAEDIIDDVEANKSTLQEMSVGSSVNLDCDNPATEGPGDSVLFWTLDSANSAGVIGAGDAFEARYENCLDTTRAHYLERVVLLTNYDPADTTGFSSFGINVDLGNLFVSETEVDLSTTPSAASPQYNGQLSLLYSEQAVAGAL